MFPPLIVNMKPPNIPLSLLNPLLMLISGVLVAEQPAIPAKIGKFAQEQRTFYGGPEGLQCLNVTSIAADPNGNIFAGTTDGLYLLQANEFRLIGGSENISCQSIAVMDNGNLFVLSGSFIYRLSLSNQQLSPARMEPILRFEESELPHRIRAFSNNLWIVFSGGIKSFRLDGSRMIENSGDRLSLEMGATADLAISGDQTAVLGAESGLYQLDAAGKPFLLYPEQENRRWAPRSVRGVAFDASGRLWMVSPQGLARREEDWQLFEGKDGLPFNDFTCLCTAADGSIWMGTHVGAIRFDGQHWFYRQGKRWLPSDEVRDIAVDPSGSVWIATAEGISKIHYQWMTLAEKAEFYESEIDRYHRRTEYEYVLGVSVGEPGKKESVKQYDSDNDGLWTAMYGAGECYAHAAKRSPESKRRARKAFEALRFLQTAPEGCEHEPPRGFVARTVVSSDWPDPNQRESYTLAGQIRRQANDRYWRAYEPRWPQSKDGKYYWKSDTSSDELDGHFYFYPLYYDLVAETEEEKEEVREVVVKLIDHLIKYNFHLVDHAGPTRWGAYSPEILNGDPEWFAARGIKSLSMLAYLNVAYHMTGDQVYRQHHLRLRDQHHYFLNTLWTEYQRGMGSGNHSDDEMFLMGFYNLIKYEPDPKFRQWYLSAYAHWWRLEEPEMNPFFNFAFAALALGQQHSTVWGTYDMSPWPTWLEDAIDTLKRFPLDRFDWSHRNSHRLDLQQLHDSTADPFEYRFEGKGYRVNGKVLPVDERHFAHWNHDPWQLDYAGSGRSLACGSVFTLPYYLGLYYGFIQD
jgi:hypothetical protein